MKKIFIGSMAMALLTILPAIAQWSGSNPITTGSNVGIGTATVNRSKFEVLGNTGNTIAIFDGGATSGVSLLGGWAGIGFNLYDNFGAKSIRPGYSGNIVLNANTGNWKFTLEFEYIREFFWYILLHFEN